MSAKTLSIIIVNFNAGAYLERCLESLSAQTIRDFEVIVVDNASGDRSLEAANRIPGIQVLRNAQNLGFAPAQNQGMRAACGRFLMALNFDIHLMPNYLENAINALDRFPGVGTLSGKLLSMKPDGTRTDIFDNAGLLLNRRRVPVHRGKGERDLGQYDQPDLVFGAMGAAAIYRRAMLDEIAYRGQFFDESYFTWYEDVDLDWRGRLSGWECLYLPSALAYHVGDPQGNRRTQFSIRHTIRNRWMMILADDGPGCIRRDLGDLFAEELALLRHVTTHGYLLAYLQALGQLARRLPDVQAKRRFVRHSAQRRCLAGYYPRPLASAGMARTEQQAERQ